MNLKHVLNCVVMWAILCQVALGAGSKANPPINTAGCQVTATNGHPTCHVNDATDKVALTVSGGSDQDCDQAGHISYPLTRWYPTKWIHGHGVWGN